MSEYRFKYFGTLAAAEEYMEHLKKYGILSRILKRRDDLYQVRSIKPDGS